VATESGGTWQPATELAGTGMLNKDGDGQVGSVSCAAPGDCLAGGDYADASLRPQVYVATETGGRWQAAQQVPGTGTPTSAGKTELDSVSCAAPGDCTAGGAYIAPDGVEWALVVSSTGGTWKKAQLLPGQSALNGDPTARAAVYSLSCPTPTSCGAGGSYIDRAGNFQALVATETGGKWGAAQELPGSAAVTRAGSADEGS